MKWKSKDLAVYEQSKEFVDTALIPLIPLSFGDRMKESAMMGDCARMIGKETERQLHGRLLLLPPFTYLKEESEQNTVTRLHSWAESLENEGFQHVFFLTSDVAWKKNEQLLHRPLLWMPAIPLETMAIEYQEDIVKEQVKQLFHVILNEWQKV